jgi:hypothetical protein
VSRSVGVVLTVEYLYYDRDDRMALDQTDDEFDSDDVDL